MSDAAQTTEQTTTSPPPSTAPQAGEEAAHWKAEAERAAQEREQWRQLALSQQPHQYEQPAPQRASSYQDGMPQRPPSSLMLENPDEYDRRMDAYLAYRDQQTLQTAAGFVGPQLADGGKFMSQSDPEYREVWQKYGNEIEQEMVRANVPIHARHKAAWDLLAGIVRGRHFRELADDLANQRLQSGGFGTEGASNVGGAPTNASDPLAAFWNTDHQWVQKAKMSGMTLQQVREHVRKQGIPEQQWVDDTVKGKSFSAEAN